MLIITFPDPETRKDAIEFLLGRFSATILRSGEVIIPENAVKSLAGRNLVFTVKGTVDEAEVASLRIAAAKSVQRRRTRTKGPAGRSRR
jgi:hypothetical protein